MPQHGAGSLPDIASRKPGERRGRDDLRAWRRADRRRGGAPRAHGPRSGRLRDRDDPRDGQLMLRRLHMAIGRLFLALLAILAATTTSTVALADYPERPITITVGFAPGG